MLCLARPKRPLSPAPVEALPQAHLAGSNLDTFAAGGGGGGSWNDNIGQRPVSGLRVWTNKDGLQAIQVMYAGGIWAPKHGDGVDNTTTWTTSDTITAVSVWTQSTQNGTYVRAVQFTMGASASPVFGKTDANKKETFSPAIQKDVLISISGRSAAWIDQLSFTFGPAVPVATIFWSAPFANPGNTGGLFMDNVGAYPAKLTKFAATADAFRLRSFTASYGGVQASQHGDGSSATALTPFVVSADDYVTQVKVYYESTSILGLQFYTKHNATSGLLGSASSTWEMVSGTPTCPVLAIIYGKSGVWIDYIQFGFTPVVADRYILKSIVYGNALSDAEELIPVSLGQASARNRTDEAQEAKLAITASITETTKWEESNSATVGITVGVEAEAGVVFAKAKTMFSLNASWTGTWTTGTEFSKTTSYTVEQTVKVEKGKSVTGTLNGSIAKATVPWTAIKVPIVGGEELSEFATRAEGVLKCGTVGNFVIEWTSLLV
eukprot:TRINITY_DN18561_c0_g1_i1.p1 TRINITY_DN18561_c0_g1~~TRINITY_DN18561_c0_g1_i1.p1  ORF type:complete len:509 (+),score=63.99 TRINITY_DN18561_c0_g1_i1:50-1528(+)